MSLGRRIGRKMARAGQPKPRPARTALKETRAYFNANYKELEEKALAKMLEAGLTKKLAGKSYDIHSLDELEREGSRLLKVYGNVRAETSPTGRMTLQDPPVYVQTREGWRRIPED